MRRAAGLAGLHLPCGTTPAAHVNSATSVSAYTAAFLPIGGVPHPAALTAATTWLTEADAKNIIEVEQQLTDAGLPTILPSAQVGPASAASPAGDPTAVLWTRCLAALIDLPDTEPTGPAPADAEAADAFTAPAHSFRQEHAQRTLGLAVPHF